uniref:Dioxygenase n=1 Tax=Paecilomyces divaricatus TaxID=644132 RepID=A0A3G1IHK0_PAEDI|nr:dioxygenase [Paecilomyces divaricatus]
MASKETFSKYPAFPDNIPTAAVPKISLRQILSRDPTVSKRLVDAGKEFGCFKVDLTDAIDGPVLCQGVERGFDLGKAFFDQDIETKKAYKLSHENVGYKQAGVLVITKERRDQVETCSVSRDDLAASRPDLPSVFDQQRLLLQGLVAQLGQLSHLAVYHLSEGLGLDYGVVSARHDPRDQSATMIRFLHNPPQRGPREELPSTEDPGSRAYLMGHSDGGTVTILFNVLGGLQLQRQQPDGSIEWQYIPPEPGCALIMVGDAFKSFTDGEVPSCVHRVIQPPGEQDRFDRYALGFFLKPANGASIGPVPRRGVTENGVNKASDYGEWAKNKNAALYNEMRQENVAI